MKVAFYHTAFDQLGGAELLAAAQARALVRDGAEVDLVAFGFDEARWRAQFPGVPVQVVPRRSWRDWFVGGPTKWRARARRAEPWLRGRDAVLAHGQPLAALLGLSQVPGRRLWYCHEAPWRRAPLAVDYTLIRRLPDDGDPAWLDPFRAMRKAVLERAGQDAGLIALERQGVARLDGVAANSAFAAAAVKAIYGLSDVRVIPPLVAFPDRLEHRAGLRRGGLQVLTVARLETLKNVEGVLRGFALYQRKAPGSRMHVVGGGREEARLRALADELGASATFHGALAPGGAELEALYRACDVFALLPLDESFGLVFPEAAARGLLVVGPDHGGPVEILEGGALGDCLPAFEPEALAEALLRMDALTDEAADRRRRALREACLARYGAGAVTPLLRRWVAG